MPSPFPGMDPYLERQWPDVHLSLISEGRRALNRALPPGTVARSEQRVVVDAEADEGGTFVQMRADVEVVDEDADAGTAATAVLIDAPYELLPAVDPVIERFLRVTDVDGRLLSVIEFVSPSNKREPGLTRFRRNRAELLAAGVHVVEIDLVRAGDWQALMSPDRCPPGADSMYRAIVRTAGEHGSAYLFPIGLRDPLPDVPVPVRAGQMPVPLPLQAMLTSAYDDGRYGRPSTYARPLDPPLDDATWVATLGLPRPV